MQACTGKNCIVGSDHSLQNDDCFPVNRLQHCAVGANGNLQIRGKTNALMKQNEISYQNLLHPQQEVLHGMTVLGKVQENRQIIHDTYNLEYE